MTVIDRSEAAGAPGGCQYLAVSLSGADEDMEMSVERLRERYLPALEALLPSEPRFIGLVGSRRHTGHHLEALRAKGVPEEVIARIQSPVGLDLGSKTPGEIALSILAGVVAVRRGGRR